MAIAFAEVRNISRGAGRILANAAAYRAAEKLHDERTGQTFDYARRGGVEHSEIVLPGHAPDWMRAREKLCNAMEAAEKRKDARLAREGIAALPHEFGAESRLRVSLDMARALVERHGVAVDFHIHAPDGEGDQRNWHTHFVMSTRRVTAAGFGEKTRELDDKRQGPQEIEAWRAAWGQCVNRELARLGLKTRIDMRSYERQGQDREGTRKLGPGAAALERRGEQTRAGNHNRDVQTRNAARARRERAAAAIRLEIERARRELAARRPAPVVDRDRQTAEAEQQAIDAAIAQENRRMREEAARERIAHAAAEGRQAASLPARKALRARIWREAQAAKKAERGAFEEWAGRKRAELQSHHLNERHELLKAQERERSARLGDLRAFYGKDIGKARAKLAAIEQRQRQKGLRGFLYRIGGEAEADRQEAEAARKGIQNAEWRMAEQMDGLTGAQQTRQADMERAQRAAVERLESRIDAVERERGDREPERMADGGRQKTISERVREGREALAARDREEGRDRDRGLER